MNLFRIGDCAFAKNCLVTRSGGNKFARIERRTLRKRSVNDRRIESVGAQSGPFKDYSPSKRRDTNVYINICVIGYVVCRYSSILLNVRDDPCLVERTFEIHAVSQIVLRNHWVRVI